MIKLIVYDLDNTLWEGTWLYDKENVKLKPKVLDLIKWLDSKGVLQTVCSKNEHDDRLENFLIKTGLRKYFIYSRINWSPKSQNIYNTKETLNLSKWQDILFVDDEEFNLLEVKNSFPEINTLNASKILDIFNIEDIKNRKTTDADKNRRQVYTDNIKRKKIAKAYAGDYQKFLKSLNMELTFSKLRKEDIPRAHQLLVRTNQWNSAIKVLDEKELEESMNKVVVARLKDKIGSYGIIGIKIEEYDLLNNKVLIDNLAISCRMAGRGLGSAFVAETVNKQVIGNKIIGQFRETKYNTKLHELYKFLSFKLAKQQENLFIYELIKNKNLSYPPWLKVISEANKIKIRKATEKDYELLCEMAKESKFTKDFPAMSYRWGWENKIMVAELNNKIVGFQYYNICKLRPWSNSYYIYIIPEMRGKGIGTILFDNFIKQSIEAGKETLKWLVPKKNIPAYNFYKDNNILPNSEDKKHHRYEIKLEKHKKSLKEYLK